MLFIFALGLYELFISKIDAANQTDNSQVLAFHSLDELKARLGRVVLMILIVNFFEHAIWKDFKTTLDLLALASSIALIALALYLLHTEAKH